MGGRPARESIHEEQEERQHDPRQNKEVYAEAMEPPYPETQDNEERITQLTNLIDACEKSERYSDMRYYVRDLVKTKNSSDVSLSVEERNRLSLAYKHVRTEIRQEWRVLNNLVTEIENKYRDANGNLDWTGVPKEKAQWERINQYQSVCAEKLKVICQEAVDMIRVPEDAEAKDNAFIKMTIPDDEPSAHEYVFFLKLRADYYRYMAEVSNDEQNNYGNESIADYKLAETVAKEHLTAIDTIWLGLALNMSVCYYETLSEKDKACKCAKEAFDSAIQQLDKLTEDNYKDSTLIMQLLRDNLALWTSDER